MFDTTAKSRPNWNPIAGGAAKVDIVQRYPGARAALRLQNSKPSFEFNVPGNVQVNQVAGISVLKVYKKDDYRELRVMKETTFKSGQLKESLIPVNIKEVKTDTAFGIQSITYRASPQNALKSGEYLLQVMGSEYDFGVD